jgi:hypothetical protein
MKNISVTNLSTNIQDYLSPEFLPAGLSHKQKIDLDSRFVGNYSFANLRALLLRINMKVSIPRIMSALILLHDDAGLLCQQGGTPISTTKMPTKGLREWERLCTTQINTTRTTRPAEIKMGKLQEVAEAIFIACYNIGLIHTGLTFIDFDADPDQKLKTFILSSMGVSMCIHTSKKRVKPQMAWRSLPVAIQTIKDINADSKCPIHISNVYLYGSLSRDAETVGDVDLSVDLSPKCNGDNLDSLAVEYLVSLGYNSATQNASSAVKKTIRVLLSKINKITYIDAKQYDKLNLGESNHIMRSIFSANPEISLKESVKQGKMILSPSN